MRSYCESVSDVVRVLKEHGVGPTRQRVVIARVLFSRAQHFSAEEIWERVKGLEPATSRATVYNTLNLFSTRGLIREVVAHPGKVYYDSNTSPHHHFYDVDTGKLMDIGSQEIEIGRLPAAPDGMVAEGVEVIVRVRGISA